MRLSISKSKNATSLYVIKSTYENGKHSSKVVEKLGTTEELKDKLGGQDPIVWAKQYIKELNKKEKEQKREVLVKYSPIKQISMHKQNTYNVGYLFLQQIYHELGLHKICQKISKKHKFNFDLNDILAKLVYARILFPTSKLATYELSKKFIEQPTFEIQHIYRALGVIHQEMDMIQADLYRNSMKISKRNTGILYYDCTNYFFEIEQEQGLKQYGPSKEHRPSPIVQMGLFIDGDGIPLAFNINKGNMNEQLSLRPLEEKILRDFKLSRFVVCTDAGLASNKNRAFNDLGARAFITTQSIKKLKAHLKKWALDPDGWHLYKDRKTYNLSEIDETANIEKTFYKERWIKENSLEQKLIVTYSVKYKNYQRRIRASQIDRALKTLDKDPGRINKRHPNDYKRFIEKKTCTADGELASRELYSINTDVIAKEEAFDGFYAVCTNLEDDATDIIKINHKRWEIEECFRIMKSEFKARPVYLSRDDRIMAHFTTCFISLLIYRILEKKLDHAFTCSDIISNLRGMDLYKVIGEGYIPTYTRNDLTDALHEAFGFRTDFQITANRQMKKIIQQTKN